MTARRSSHSATPARVLDDVEPLLSRYHLGTVQLDQLTLHYTRKPGGHSNFDALTGADGTATKPAAAAGSSDSHRLAHRHAHAAERPLRLYRCQRPQASHAGAAKTSTAALRGLSTAGRASPLRSIWPPNSTAAASASTASWTWPPAATPASWTSRAWRWRRCCRWHQPLLNAELSQGHAGCRRPAAGGLGQDVQPHAAARQRSDQRSRTAAARPHAAGLEVAARRHPRTSIWPAARHNSTASAVHGLKLDARRLRNGGIDLTEPGQVHARSRPRASRRRHASLALEHRSRRRRCQYAGARPIRASRAGADASRSSSTSCGVDGLFRTTCASR